MSLCRKITDIYIFFMLSVFPFFTGLQGYANITDSKFYCFAAATLLWLAALLLCAIVGRVSPSVLPLKDPISIFTYVFILLCCISALCSPFFEQTLFGSGRWDGLATWLLYIAVFLGVRFSGRLRPAHLYGAGISLVLCTIIAIAQLSGRDPLGLFPGDLNYFDANLRYSGEFLGTIGNVDLLAAYLCLLIPLLAGHYIANGRSPLLLFPAAAGSFLLVVSGVAGGLLALLVSSLVAAPILLRSHEKLIRASYAVAALLFGAFWAFAIVFKSEGISLSLNTAAYITLFVCLIVQLFAVILCLQTPRRRLDPASYSKLFLTVIAAFILLALLLLYFYPGTSGTVYEFSRILHGDIQDSFGSSRIRIWRETLALVSERPIFGGGPGTIAERLQIEFSRYVPETGKTLRSFVDNAHNMYLTILADIGIPGLLSYLALMLLSFLSWIKQRDTVGSAIPFGCAVLCYWIQDFFGLGLCLVAPMFWLLWGLLTAKNSERPDAPAKF